MATGRKLATLRGTHDAHCHDTLIDELLFVAAEIFLRINSTYTLATAANFRDRALAVCGVLGFGGKFLRGALVLATTSEPREP